MGRVGRASECMESGSERCMRRNVSRSVLGYGTFRPPGVVSGKQSVLASDRAAGLEILNEPWGD
jgi:hypothetical protein